jgi:hypothetical protein
MKESTVIDIKNTYIILPCGFWHGIYVSALKKFFIKRA